MTQESYNHDTDQGRFSNRNTTEDGDEVIWA